LAYFSLKHSFSDQNSDKTIDSETITYGPNRDQILEQHTSDFLFFGIHPELKTKIQAEAFQLTDTPDFELNSAAFSFIFFDKKKNTIKLYRDFFGTLPLFFSVKNKTLFVSNSLRKVATWSGLKINENQIAKYFNADFEDNTIDSDTFFENVFRVLPGHLCLISENKIRQQKHSEVVIGETKNFKSIFFNEINKFKQSEQKPGAHLSGGLDSSSIVSLLKTEKPEAFYFDPGKENTNEHKIAKWVAAKLEVNLNEIKFKTDYLAYAKRSCEITFQPEQMVIPSATFLKILEKAQDLGVQQMISGHGGDAIVGYGFEYLNALFEQKKYSLYKKELKKYVKIQNENRQKTEIEGKLTVEKLMGQAFLKKLKKSLLNGNVKTVFELCYTFLFKLKVGVFPIFKVITSRLDKVKEIPLGKKLKIKSPKINDVTPQSERLNFDGNNYQKSLLDSNFITLSAIALETLYDLHQAYEVTPKYPFLNKELLESSLNTPLSKKFFDGYGRGDLRAAMQGNLPDKVRLRTSKGAFNNYHLEHLQILHVQTEYDLKTTHKVWQYINKNTFERAIAIVLNPNFTSKQKNNQIWFCSKTISLAIWLDTLDSAV
jgi:asparagine synthase (glutamine-hydrolysing)